MLRNTFYEAEIRVQIDQILVKKTFIYTLNRVDNLILLHTQFFSSTATIQYVSFTINYKYILFFSIFFIIDY
jgi:hypothetical protein